MHNSLTGRAERFYGFPLRDRVCDWRSEWCEAIEDGDPDVHFGDLTVEVACRQTMT